MSDVFKFGSCWSSITHTLRDAEIRLCQFSQRECIVQKILIYNLIKI